MSSAAADVKSPEIAIARRYDELLAGPSNRSVPLIELNSQIDDLFTEGKAIHYDKLIKSLSKINPFTDRDRRHYIIAAIRDSMIVGEVQETITEWDDELGDLVTKWRLNPNLLRTLGFNVDNDFNIPFNRYEIYTEEDKLRLAERWASGLIPRLTALEGSLMLDKHGIERTILPGGFISDGRGGTRVLELKGGKFFLDENGSYDGVDDVREAFYRPKMDGQGHKRIEAYAVASGKEFWAPEKAKIMKKVVHSRFGITRADEIEPEAMHWVWGNRIPRGMLSLLAGDGDMGKSTILCDIIARITSGTQWPDGKGKAPRGRVLLFNIEDHKKKTLIGRLQASGADMSKVEIITHINADDGTKERFSLARTDHRDSLRALVRDFGDVQLIIFDPISTYFGDGVNAWKESEVRGVLEPLSDLAEELDIAVIGNAHLGKANRGVSNANLQILNSVAVSSVARVINQVDEDPDEDEEGVRVFGPTKRNVAKPVPPLRYVIESIDLETREVVPADQDDDSNRLEGTRVRWLGPANKSIRDLRMARPNKPGPDDEVREEAVRFYREYLGKGPRDNERVNQAARASGFSQRTLARARLKLGLRYFYEGSSRMVALPEWETNKPSAPPNEW